LVSGQRLRVEPRRGKRSKRDEECSPPVIAAIPVYAQEKPTSTTTEGLKEMCEAHERVDAAKAKRMIGQQTDFV
jgi:hypothetical protein